MKQKQTFQPPTTIGILMLKNKKNRSGTNDAVDCVCHIYERMKIVHMRIIIMKDNKSHKIKKFIETKFPRCVSLFISRNQ